MRAALRFPLMPRSSPLACVPRTSMDGTADNTEQGVSGYCREAAGRRLQAIALRGLQDVDAPGGGGGGGGG